MTPRIVFRPAARTELRDACDWYDGQQAGLGLALAQVVADTLDRIEAHPTLYPRVEGEVRRAVLARFPYGLFYRVGSEAIEVLAVFHHRRDPQVWRERASV